VLSATPAPHVDHVCNANELALFAEATFAEIYASHVLEHLDYEAELGAALKDWLRVLEPGGRILVSVPDLDVLARLIVSKSKLTIDDRFLVMRMMFGGHVDMYDYHVVGLNEEFLDRYLRQAGYVNVRRVEEFGLFEDSSSARLAGQRISLNMIAEKPGAGADITDIADAIPAHAGRNRPCPCGSGKKFKHCHGKNA
jgi:predicted SAM-dependent methyltransferase